MGRREGSSEKEEEMRFRVSTPISEEEVTITQLPGAMEKAERNMNWLREGWPEYELVNIILEVID